jgi:hypothetical protein
MPAPTDILDEGIIHVPSSPEEIENYVGDWIPTYGLAQIAITSSHFESDAVTFMIKESLDGVEDHSELGPFNSRWWTPEEITIPPGGFRNTWVPAMRYMRLAIYIQATAAGQDIAFSMRGIRC